MRIGQFVQRNAAAILAHCAAHDPTEFARLQDPRYCKDTFDINYPFCKPVAQIGADQHVRFYRATHEVLGVRVRVTSQWFHPPHSDSFPKLRHYMAQRGIVAQGPSDAIANEGPDPNPTPRAPQGRFRGNAIGNAQNAFVRHLLSRIGDENFGAAQWQAVIAAFDHRCAYCGAPGDLVMDHVIPINRTALGEHRLGNLAPACHACNSRKGDQDYRVFLAQDAGRIAALDSHMARHGYEPMGDNPKLQRIIDLAHQDVCQLADHYAQVLSIIVESDEEGG